MSAGTTTGTPASTGTRNDRVQLRLLAGWAEEGRPATLSMHLRRFGPQPAPQRVRRWPDRGLVELVDRAGLIGHGGAGFPAARKMRAVIEASRLRRPLVVANGADGEPASGKDAALLHIAPHLVLDGVTLAARAVGAGAAVVCVHGSASSAALARAIEERRGAAVDDVAVTVREIPSRYVSSEESAIVRWLSGGPALPTLRPPRAAERGVNGRPTLIHNVETLAQLALIARYGAQWFRTAGTPEEPGTMLVTVGGAVTAPGVYEVPRGLPLTGLLDIAGGPTRPLQALLVGGYFGAWLPMAPALRLPLTHRDLRAAGAALGAGIVVALPVEACGLIETARVAGYLSVESAGQCGPCRNGLPAIAGALAGLAVGEWSPGRAGDLDRWLGVVPGRGACGLPDGAVRFVASALDVFSDEVAHHARAGGCSRPAAPPVLPVPGYVDRLLPLSRRTDGSQVCA